MCWGSRELRGRFICWVYREDYMQGRNICRVSWPYTAVLLGTMYAVI